MATIDEDAELNLQRHRDFHQLQIALGKHEVESVSDYFYRISRRGQFKRGSYPTRRDVVVRYVFERLGHWAYEINLSMSTVRARSLTKNYRYCCCVDVRRWKARDKESVPNFTVADIQKSAQNGERCVRCWFIAECVLRFADRWPGVATSAIRLRTDTKIHEKVPLGPILLLSVRWNQPGMSNYSPYIQPVTRSKLLLEIFHEKGGHSLYPCLTPRPVVPAVSDAYNCASIIRAWMENCTRSHGSCNRNLNTDFLPTRLIEIGSTEGIGRVKLVNSVHICNRLTRFTALSHCWGSAEACVKPIPKTDRATLQNHLIRITWESLTSVFKDAIAVTRALGLRHIWIDSLCILQDDEEDFAFEASQMDLIYGEAYIVLAATRAPTGDWGLFYHRPRPHSISHQNKDGTLSTVLVRERMEHEEFISEEPRSFESTPLFARAWCFQERLLARRVVHFAEKELLFECRESLECECKWPETSVTMYRTFKSINAYALTKVSARRRYEAWNYALRIYTTRSLTYEKDRLPALSGYARQLAVPEMGTYYAGMWRNQLPSSFLWQVHRQRPGSDGIIKRSNPCKSPTWSWASVEAVIQGHIDFHDGVADVAKVLEVQCTLSTQDTYGAVEESRIVLEGPSIETTIQAGTSDTCQNDRKYSISMLAMPNEALQFEADVPVDTTPKTLCLAIQHDTKGVYDGCWSCLVLRKDSVLPHYNRVGRFDAPSHWFHDAQTMIVNIY